MPLIDHLNTFSKPGNPDGVCALSSAVTAHVLMNGPDALSDLTSVKLPLKGEDGISEIPMEKFLKGGGPAKELDVTRLPEQGQAKIWKHRDDENEIEGGDDMVEWLKSDKAPPGVYVGCVDQPDDDDEHFFNIAKTDDGTIYLVDSSTQNYLQLKEGKDLEPFVTKVEGEEDIPLYSSSKMKLDFCGRLDERCAEELKQSLKRSVRQDYQPSVKDNNNVQKLSIT